MGAHNQYLQLGQVHTNTTAAVALKTEDVTCPTSGCCYTDTTLTCVYCRYLSLWLHSLNYFLASSLFVYVSRTQHSLFLPHTRYIYIQYIYTYIYILPIIKDATKCIMSYTGVRRIVLNILFTILKHPKKQNV